MKMATTICHLSMKLEGGVCEKLRALLGFFVLEITVPIPPFSKSSLTFIFIYPISTEVPVWTSYLICFVYFLIL
ncbi:hypothetical protein ABKV19_007629 [Rosa sericea]